jgi:hypothetical protein
MASIMKKWFQLMLIVPGFFFAAACTSVNGTDEGSSQSSTDNPTDSETSTVTIFEDEDDEFTSSEKSTEISGTNLVSNSLTISKFIFESNGSLKMEKVFSGDPANTKFKFEIVTDAYHLIEYKSKSAIVPPISGGSKKGFGIVINSVTSLAAEIFELISHDAKGSTLISSSTLDFGALNKIALVVAKTQKRGRETSSIDLAEIAVRFIEQNMKSLNVFNKNGIDNAAIAKNNAESMKLALNVDRVSEKLSSGSYSSWDVGDEVSHSSNMPNIDNIDITLEVFKAPLESESENQFLVEYIVAKEVQKIRGKGFSSETVLAAEDSLWEQASELDSAEIVATAQDDKTDNAFSKLATELGETTTETEINSAVTPAEVASPQISIPNIVGAIFPNNDLYIGSETLTFTLTFSENVVVIGTPTVDIQIGDLSEELSYDLGSGSSALVFKMDITSNMNAYGGVSTGSSLNLNGGSISSSDGVAANLAISAQSLPDVQITNSFSLQLGASSAADGGANSNKELCSSIAVDSLGNTHCFGNTNGATVNTGGGDTDILIQKMDSNGKLVRSIQLGASYGNTAGADTCNDVTVDSDDNLYCAGTTNADLGEGNGGGFDAVVFKMNPAGEIVWLTQFGDTTKKGGQNNTLADECYGVAVDDLGNVYCAGSTMSSMGEANAGGRDAFVMKLDTNGDLVWLTQVGVTTGAGGAGGSDDCNDVVVDDSYNVFCAGSTTGNLAETNGGNADPFIIKLNSSGVLQWKKQLGTTTVFNNDTSGGSSSGTEYCESVALDSSNNIYCGGSTDSSLAEANGGSTDMFVWKINTSGVSQWVTQIGDTSESVASAASAADDCMSLAVDASDNIFCAGKTAGDWGDTNGGSDDFAVLKLDSSGAVLDTIQIGANAGDLGDASGGEATYGMHIDSKDNLYIAGTTNGSFAESNGGSNDILLIKLTAGDQ